MGMKSDILYTQFKTTKKKLRNSQYNCCSDRWLKCRIECMGSQIGSRRRLLQPVTRKVAQFIVPFLCCRYVRRINAFMLQICASQKRQAGSFSPYIYIYTKTGSESPCTVPDCLLFSQHYGGRFQLTLNMGIILHYPVQVGNLNMMCFDCKKLKFANLTLQLISCFD